MRKKVRYLGGGLLSVALTAHCGNAGPHDDLFVGSDDGGGTGPFVGADATASGALDAHIEEKGVQVKFVTVDCSGPCADVRAVATGGNPPYSFAWEDHSTSPTRHLCPAASTSYSVTVTDTGTSGELATPPQTAKAPLTGEVLACPDAGGVDGGATALACEPQKTAPFLMIHNVPSAATPTTG